MSRVSRLVSAFDTRTLPVAAPMTGVVELLDHPQHAVGRHLGVGVDGEDEVPGAHTDRDVLRVPLAAVRSGSRTCHPGSAAHFSRTGMTSWRFGDPSSTR